MRSPSRLALIGLNLVVYYLLLRWVAGNVQPARLMEHLRQIPLWALAGSLALNFAGLALYGARLSLLLGRDFRTGFSIVNLGYALNTLMPLRLGDAIKIYLGHRLFATPLLGILAASVAEKVVDLSSVLLIGLVVAAYAAGEAVSAGVLLPISVLVAAGAALFVVFRFYIVAIVKMLPKRGRLRRMFIQLHKHADAYPVARVLAFTAAIWTLNLAQVYYSFNAFLPGLDLGIADSAKLLLIVALAIAIPSAPAGIGLFEAGIVAYLTTRSGVSNEAGLAAAAVFHLVVALPQLVIAGLLVPALWLPAGKPAAEQGQSVEERAAK